MPRKSQPLISLSEIITALGLQALLAIWKSPYFKCPRLPLPWGDAGA